MYKTIIYSTYYTFQSDIYWLHSLKDKKINSSLFLSLNYWKILKITFIRLKTYFSRRISVCTIIIVPLLIINKSQVIDIVLSIIQNVSYYK